MEGVLNVFKEEDMTSHDVVAILRGTTGQRRMGHTGTLDPQVTGVLPICLGRATKLADYISEQGKTYEGSLVFGIRTDTLDLGGEITERSDQTRFSPEEIRRAMKAFIGTIQQVPPMYSAVQVQGQRLYDLARQGKKVERKAREVTIYDFSPTAFHEEGLDFTCSCSKGTYIRTLVDDLGKALGTWATTSRLVRTRVGPFSIDRAVPISRLRTMNREEIASLLLPMDQSIPHLPILDLGSSEGKVLRLGGFIRQSQLADSPPDKLYRIYDPQGFIGLGYFDGEKERLRMKKVLA
ncbi:tRNA pseudouridine(55) synthase TruB [Kallipyga massiliensis]|uniref:tRNA pseudouridine(55) synthase TruB n=1 Tax=Kallipyga massiliensis TaxID=1472764 RepID=UPI0026F1FDFC|nr:tRNA pseudouridine(55) synthase TruB [Kallipyga massiliensis]